MTTTPIMDNSDNDGDSGSHLRFISIEFLLPIVSTTFK